MCVRLEITLFIKSFTSCHHKIVLYYALMSALIQFMRSFASLFTLFSMHASCSLAHLLLIIENLSLSEKEWGGETPY